MLEITSVRTEAGSGQANRYVFIQCSLSPEVAGSPWVLRGGVEVEALFLRCLQLRGTAEALCSLPVQVGLSSKAFLSCLQWRTWPVPFHKFSSFLFEGWSYCYVPSQGCLWSVLCTVRCMSAHWVHVTPTNHCSILNNFVPSNPLPNIDKLKHFFSW